MTAMPVGSLGGGPRRCWFCGRREASVRHLVRAREALICESCVAQAHQALAEASPDQKLVRIKPRPGRPADRDAAEAAIEEAFETVFGPDVAIDARCAAVEGGANLASTMQETQDRFGGRLGVDVSVDHVRFLGDDEAEVSFVIILPGSVGPMPGMGGYPTRIPNLGYAVLVDGTWKVARETYCGQVQRIGVQCPPPPD
jgi:ClpX C4-type zinc finger